ncbi:Cytochrome b5 isoform 1 [Triticum urartu]|uniref:Cytochrome b5 isoform 1 n=1 Tax=Triticum urartu TaxID=4572 RepID=M8A0M0_TRIUA|nr:Cytochrome b5 isoform 1 [Triticum urartu]
MAGGGKVYSFQEVRKHSQRKDCWLIISGKVYDVTPFMEEHPGGDEVLLACTGKDATADFEDIGHSDAAKAAARPASPAGGHGLRASELRQNQNRVDEKDRCRRGYRLRSLGSICTSNQLLSTSLPLQSL